MNRDKLTLDEYQEMALQTRESSTMTPENVIIYPTLGLTGESGEVADKVKKAIRDDEGVFTSDRKHKVSLELGDVMWYAANLAHDLGMSLSDVCKANLNKIADRKLRNKIRGSGDER